MSKISLSGNSSGTGTLTIASPNTNSDRTLTLPDSTGTIATAESTLTQFNASGSAPVYACRAWVNFNGTGTVAIRASGNVSSITDNGTGDYTVNFTTAMQDVNYTPTPMVLRRGNATFSNWWFMNQHDTSPKQTTSIRITTATSNGLGDVDDCGIAIFR